MLANASIISAPVGSLAKDLHKPATFLLEMLSFLEGELPAWRDRADRKAETSETILTSQLCAHLNSAARRSNCWDVLQFRTEEADEGARGRKIDLVPAPCDVTIWVDGRRHVDFDQLLPIECKRLPTPKDGGRDEREYVFTSSATTGGIQRFKAGLHGARHKLGAMVGYIQDNSASHWNTLIAGWINGLVASGQSGWNTGDHLTVEREDLGKKISVLNSQHSRDNGLSDISLRHLWVEMK